MDTIEKEGGRGLTGKRLKLYLAATLLILIAALVSFLIVPAGSGAGVCSRYVIQQSKNTCIMNAALSGLNASACAQLPSAYSDTCYLQVAAKAGDSRVCGHVSDSAQAYSCTASIAISTGNYSLCGGIGEPYISKCREAIAVKSNNVSMCTGVPNATSSEICSAIIYIKKAQLSGKFQVCANVTGSNSQYVTDYVIGNISSSSTGPATGIGSAFQQIAFIPNMTYSARDVCYDVLAEELGNATLCSMISGTSARNLCAAQIKSNSNATSNYTQMLAGCAQMGYVSTACTQAVMLAEALRTRNASMCGSIGGAGSDSCYLALAKAYTNSSYCSYIVNASQRSSCTGSTENAK
ncbi:Uncharacterised protein [uncultured archaeon]|nr:Uncharacterised protein [uncultured archaeon]